MPSTTSARGWCSIPWAALSWCSSLAGIHAWELISPLWRCCFAIMSSLFLCQDSITGRVYNRKGIGNIPWIRKVIFPQAKGPPISNSGQNWVFPLNVLSQHSSIYSFWVFPSGLASWTSSPRAQLICTWIHANFLHPQFSSEKSPIGLPLIMQKIHPFVCLFWICYIKTLLGKCSKKTWNKLL